MGAVVHLHCAPPHPEDPKPSSQHPDYRSGHRKCFVAALWWQESELQQLMFEEIQ